MTLIRVNTCPFAVFYLQVLLVPTLLADNAPSAELNELFQT